MSETVRHNENVRFPLRYSYSPLLCGMKEVAGSGISVEFVGGDIPASYTTFPGFPAGPAAFGSDAPHLLNFRRKIICGPGSIRFAHRDDEHILVQDLEDAVQLYIKMYQTL